ncbi:MAG: respiratory nitrate reductase subunit gamma [Candidatus Angelobacter sp.]
MKINFLFAAWPYIALSLFLVGIGVRYVRDRRQIAAVTTDMSEAWELFCAGKLWRVNILLLLIGHAVGLLFPRVIFWWNSSQVRLYLLEGAAFVIGTMVLAGWFLLIWRHLGRSNRSAITELSDTVFLSLLFIGILSGLLMAVLYRWGSSWGAMIIAPYVASLVHANPAAGLAMQMPFLVRLHIFASFSALAVLPLTRLAAFAIVALDRLFGLIGRPVSASAHAAEAWVHKHNPASWLWPEED